MKKKQTTTAAQIIEQVEAHGIEFGDLYTDPASGFEGEVQSMYFFKHGCLRVELRGRNKTSGEPSSYTFDAPDLVKVETQVAVPKGPRTGGPHDLATVSRGGPS